MPFECPTDNVVCSSATVVFLGVALFAGREVLDGGVALNSVLLCQTCVDSGVNCSELDLALELTCSLVPMRLQALKTKE